jgi:RNA polymerase sigma-70 factor (ECF subfamily)
MGVSDPAADGELAHVYRTYITMIRRRCLRIVGDQAMSDDIAQDVFVAYAEKYGAKRPPDKVGALLYTMATHRALNQLRDGRRRGEILRAEARSEAHTGGHDAELDVRRVLTLVDRELATLAIYYHVDGMDQDEIARVTGLHRRTVSRRLEDFRVAAQRLLAREGGRS